LQNVEQVVCKKHDHFFLCLVNHCQTGPVGTLFQEPAISICLTSVVQNAA